MASVSTHNERQQLEKDIESIKSALQFSGDPEIEDSEEDEDALKIICPEWTSDGEQLQQKAIPSTSSEQSTGTSAYIKQDDGIEDDLSANNDQLIEMGVALNKAYQEIVSESLEMIQLLLAQNHEKQKETEDLISERFAAKGHKIKRRSPTNYGYPYFRDKDGMPPPINYEAQCKKAVDEPEPYLRPVKIWTDKEKATLKNAVQEDLIKQQIRPILNRKELDMEKLAEAKKQNDTEQIEMLSEKIKKHDDDIHEIKTTPLHIPEDVDSYIDKVDWLKISAIDFNGNRRFEECYVFWRNHLQPYINSSKWTQDEDKLLGELAKEFNCSNWESIAQKLGSQRSAFQCLQRYQTKLNPYLQVGKWTTEEDNFLKEVISSVRIGEAIHWDQVSYYMDFRSNEQCEERWQQLQNICKLGRWTEEEDKLLQDAIDRYGKEWIKVQEMVPNRNGQQCRERYMNSLCRGTKTGTWRYAEDRILWQCCEGLTTFKWTQIAANIPGRSDNACLQRYRLLLRLKHVEDILLKTADGKIIIDKLLRKIPIPKNATVQSQTKRELKFKNMKRRIQEEKDIITDAQKKIDLLKISTSSRTERSLHYQKDRILDAKQKISSLEKRMLILQNQRTNVIPPEPLKYQDILSDMTEALHDRDDGMYVPRPLLGMHGLKKMLSSLENQLRLKKLIQRRTEMLLRDVPDGSTLSLDLGSELDDNQSEVATGKRVTKKVEKIDPRKRKPCNEDTRVCQQIFDIFNGYTRKQSAGRPRKCGQRSPDDPEETEKLLCEHNVFRIFVGALNFDVEGAKIQSKKRLKETSSTLADLRMKTLRADLELFQKALNCEVNDPEHGEPTQSSRTTLTNISLQMLPRRAIQGPTAVRAYNLPPLPPTVCTMMGFKSLLLKRRQLIELSNKKLTIVPEKRPAKSRGIAKAAKKRRLNNEQGGDTSLDGPNNNIETKFGMDRSGITMAEQSLPEMLLSHKHDVPHPEATAVREHECNGFEQIPGVPITEQPSVAVSGCSSMPQLVSAPVKQNEANSHSLAGNSTSLIIPGFQSSKGSALKDPFSQTRVMILKGCDFNPDTLGKMLKSRGFIADPDKVKLRMCKRSELAKRIMANSGKVNKSMGRRVQSKRTRKKALAILRQTHDFQLLKARFTSLFLWPALLSTIAIGASEGAQAKQEQTSVHSDQEQQSQQQQAQAEQEKNQQKQTVHYPGYQQSSCQKQNPSQKEQCLEAGPSPKKQLQQQQQPQEEKQQQSQPEMLEDGEEWVDDLNDESIVIPEELLRPIPQKPEQAHKKSKKQKTKRNRYPCSGGKRFRKRIMQPRWIKEQEVERYRQARLKHLMKKAKQQQQMSELDASNTDQRDVKQGDAQLSVNSNESLAGSDVGQVRSEEQTNLSTTGSPSDEDHPNRSDKNMDQNDNNETM